MEQLTAQVAWLTQQLFGAKSEKLDPNQELLELEGEEGKKPEPPSDVPADEPEEAKGKRNRRTKEEIYNYEKLPKVIVDEKIPAEVLANPDAYERIGEDYHDELDYLPGGVQVARTVIPKFCKKDEKSHPPRPSPRA